MTARTRITLLLILFAAAGVRADVAPFPSWRIAVDGYVAQAVQVGSTVFVGGGFSKIGTAVAPFSAMLDLATLSFATVTGCARYGQQPLAAGVIAVGAVTPAAMLSDANGPFVVPAGTALVRVGTDCRFDRRFRVAMPAGVQLWPSFGAQIVESTGRVYFQVSLGESSASPVYLVEADAVTGAVLRYWPAGATPYRIRGALPGGRLLATSGDLTFPSGLGWIDVAQGATFHLRRALPAWSTSQLLTGDVVVLSTSPVFGSSEIVALDAGTLAPLANWPEVRASYAPVATSDAGRLFLAGQGLIVNGAPAPRILSFDAVSGARLGGFVPPAWMNEVSSWFTSLALAGSRVIVFGNFAPGAPRDTVAALDAASGALDPWMLPFVTTSGGSPVGGRRYFPMVTTQDRVARNNLAAVDARTGQVLAWTADSPSVTALAADAAAGQLYVASPGRVRRYDVTTGATDPLWTFDVSGLSSTPSRVTGLAVGFGRVYATGDFSQARDGASAPWQPREAAAAMTSAGALTPWRPALRPDCTPPGRVPPPTPCVEKLRISQGRVFLHGNLMGATGATAALSLMAVSADTGAVDPVLPEVPVPIVGDMDAAPEALFLDARIGTTRYIASFSASAGARLLAPVNPAAGFSLAAFDDRVYLDVERDAATGAPTGNPVTWRAPVAAIDGVADRDEGSGLSWYARLAPRAPHAPTNLSVSLDGPRVTFRWSPGVGELAPFGGVVAGASAATTHVLQASLTAGAPPVAQLDTQSADTTVTLDVPTGVFFVRVQARNAFGASPPSADVRVDVRTAAPEPPVATVATLQGRVVRVGWQAPARGWLATGYRLEAGTTPGAADLGVLPVDGLEFQAPVPAGRYYVRVRAVNAVGSSVPGDEVVIDVP